MIRSCVFLVILVGITSISGDGSAAQFGGEPPETIGVSKNLVLMDARVIDKNGNPVTGLQKEDFRLYQDGRVQEITEFYPMKRGSAASKERIVVFIIDDLGLSKEKFYQVRTALRHFIDKIMRPTDQVAIARTAGGGVVLQPLTSDAARVRAAAGRWQWSIETGRPLRDIVRTASVAGTTFVQSCSGSS
jgi:VWFA-related protein